MPPPVCPPVLLWWQSLIIGVSGGLSVWLVGILREEYFKWRDKKRVLAFMKKNSTNVLFRTTHAIASHVNLTEDRVIYICSVHPGITRNEKEIEVWRLA
jgi:hypothetical protein